MNVLEHHGETAGMQQQVAVRGGGASRGFELDVEKYGESTGEKGDAGARSRRKKIHVVHGDEEHGRFLLAGLVYFKKAFI